MIKITFLKNYQFSQAVTKFEALKLFLVILYNLFVPSILDMVLSFFTLDLFYVRKHFLQFVLPFYLAVPRTIFFAQELILLTLVFFFDSFFQSHNEGSKWLARI